jgi:hypothetical protein
VSSTKKKVTDRRIEGSLGVGTPGVAVAAQDDVTPHAMFWPPGAIQLVQVRVEMQFVGQLALDRFGSGGRVVGWGMLVRMERLVVPPEPGAVVGLGKVIGMVGSRAGSVKCFG